MMAKTVAHLAFNLTLHRQVVPAATQIPSKASLAKNLHDDGLQYLNLSQCQ